MRIIDTIAGFEEIEKGCVLTIGNFDGVHIGHRQILAAAREIAIKKHSKLAVMTFEPHPVTILYPEKAPGILTPRLLKKHLLADAGADYRLALKTSLELLALSPADFIEQFIVNTFQPSVIVEGDDFNFGSNRQGNIETIKELGIEKGFEVVVVSAQKATLSTGQTVRVSSTIIRYMLEGGHAADAAVALGRPYRLIGQITPGRGKGKQLGFPTLNMKKPKQIIPAEGVYAGTVEIADTEDSVCIVKQKIPAVFSVGQTSTYGPNQPLQIESHLLIADAERLTGRYMAMDFVEFIRTQHKFGNETKLTAQIAIDCEKAGRILKEN